MIIYEALNTITGKVYVGLTTKTLDHRMKGHLRSSKCGVGSYFYKALRKYGEENFEWDAVLKANSLEELYRLEKLQIGLYEPWQTYNVSLGGEHSAYGLRHSEETKRVCGQYARNRWNGKRAKDLFPPECFLLETYREAKKMYGVPKTTWYRHRSLT